MRMWSEIIRSFVYITSILKYIHTGLHTSRIPSQAGTDKHKHVNSINVRHKANKTVTAEQLHDRFEIHPMVEFTT